MKKLVICLTLAVLVITSFGLILPAFADGEDPPENPGDPYDLSPGCEPLGPTPHILQLFWTVIVTAVTSVMWL